MKPFIGFGVTLNFTNSAGHKWLVASRLTFDPRKNHTAVGKVDYGFERDSLITVLPRRLARTAACSSNRGIVSSFNGATRDLAATNLTLKLPSNSFHLTYAHVPNARRDASQKMISVGFPIVPDGVRHRGNFTLLRAEISWKSFNHFRCSSVGISSSHPTPSCQSSCIAIFDLTIIAAATPIGSKIPAS